MFLAKAIGSGIGLASEAIQHKREKKQQSASEAANVPTRSASGSGSPSVSSVPSSSQPPDETGNDKGPSTTATEDGYNADEAVWELDDMCERVDPPAYAEDDPTQRPRTDSLPRPDDSDDVKLRKHEAMVQALVQQAGPVPQPANRLACPVILPQRRPGKKDRGFVRAYAPVLADCGLDEAVFLRFLKYWHTASKASPWIDVVFVAAGIAGFVPSAGAQITSIVVQAASGAARELQSRHRNSSFLDQANRQLFMPRGLFALVMAFKDEDQQAGLVGVAGSLGKSLFHAQRLDVRQPALQQAAAAASSAVAGPSTVSSRLRVASGKTYAELELPQAAELVYPGIDRAAEDDLAAVSTTGTEQEKAGIKAKWRSAGKFVKDYVDRRAQAEFEMQHQGSSLSVPASQRKPFTSRYSDPAHPANSGSLVALLTGGAVQGRGGLGRRGGGPIGLVGGLLTAAVSSGGNQNQQQIDRSPTKNRQRPLKKMMKQDVLYLLIVNLPTDEEVEASAAQLEDCLSQYSYYQDSRQEFGVYDSSVPRQ